MHINPEVLVLGPGGVKGFLQLGALYRLEQDKMLDNIQIYCGVSVGAIISLMMVCGYTISEIIMDAVDMDLFEDFSNISISKIPKKIGIMSNKAIKKKLEEKIIQKF